MFYDRLKRALGFAGKKASAQKEPLYIHATEADAAHLAGIRSVKDVALLVIDVQEQFCGLKAGSLETDRIALSIGNIAPAFRAASVSLYAIYLHPFGPLPLEKVKFHHFKVKRDYDTPLQKTSASAFSDTKLDQLLKGGKKKQLLLAGFNLQACVLATATAARKRGYDVYLLQDLCGSNPSTLGSQEEALIEMKKNGVHIVHSDSVMKRLKEIRKAV